MEEKSQSCRMSGRPAPKALLGTVLLLQAGLLMGDPVDRQLIVQAERDLRGDGELAILPSDLLCVRRAVLQVTQEERAATPRATDRRGGMTALQQSRYANCMIDEIARSGVEP